MTCKYVASCWAGVLLFVALLLSPGASAQAAPWTLIDQSVNQNLCIRSASLPGYEYFTVWISGTWTKPITVGVTSLPQGAETWNQTIPPQSNNSGIYSLTSLQVRLPAGLTPATYAAVLWASDGTSTQGVPVSFRVAPTSCRKY